MKVHFFKGNVDSSHYITRLGHIFCFEASSWREMLPEVFKIRTRLSDDWEEEMVDGIDWFEKPFVKLLMREDTPRTQEGVRSVVQEMASDPTKELFCQKVILSMNEEIDYADRLLLIEETAETLPLLTYLGVVENPR